MEMDLIEVTKKGLASGRRHWTEDMSITVNMATLITEQLSYIGQRPIRKTHVDLFVAAIQARDFIPHTNIEFGVLDGRLHFVNGHHRVHAVIETGKPQIFCVHFHVVDSEEGLAYLYSKFDTTMKVRSPTDIMGDIDQELGLSRTEARTLNSAVGMLSNGLRPVSGSDSGFKRYKSKNYALRNVEMREWIQQAQLYFQCIRNAPSCNRTLFNRRSSLLAVALLTLYYFPEKARDFWRGAADDDGLRQGDPRKALVNWLQRNSVGGKQSLQHRAAIACWNAFIDGSNLERVYPNTEKALKIEGTPIDLRSPLCLEKHLLPAITASALD